MIKVTTVQEAAGGSARVQNHTARAPADALLLTMQTNKAATAQYNPIIACQKRCQKCCAKRANPPSKTQSSKKRSPAFSHRPASQRALFFDTARRAVTKAPGASSTPVHPPPNLDSALPTRQPVHQMLRVQKHAQSQGHNRAQRGHEVPGPLAHSHPSLTKRVSLAHPTPPLSNFLSPRPAQKGTDKLRG